MVCIDCNKYKKLYTKNRCKACWTRWRYIENPESYRRALLYQREYKTKNWNYYYPKVKDKINARRRELYREKHPELERVKKICNVHSTEFYTQCRKCSQKKYYSTENYKLRHRIHALNNHHKRKSGFPSNSDVTSKYLEELWDKTSICVLCGFEMENHRKFPKGRHLDHILPISQGGLHMKNNIRYIHAICNLTRKRNKLDK